MRKQFTLLVALSGALGMFGAACSNSSKPLAHEQIVEQLSEDGVDDSVASCAATRSERAGVTDSEVGKAKIKEITQECVEANEALARLDAAGVPEQLAEVAEPSVYGDDPALDELWDLCKAGSGASCDELFKTAPLGSEYEAFGLTCGERPSVLHCTEMDRPEADQPIPEIATTTSTTATTVSEG